LASNQVSATVLPTAPTGLTATASSASVALTWSAGKGAASYNVYEGASAGAEGSAVVMNVSGTTATVTGLSNSTTYYFTVSSVNSAGTSAPSNEASATPTAASSGGGGGGLGILDLLLASVLLLCRLAWPAGRAQRA
jgi:chitodextrinase